MNKPLIIFEMANNHMGDFEHAQNMIYAYANIAKDFQDTFRFAWKFQFRHLETFIHNSQKNNTDHAYIQRFLKTNLSYDQFKVLTELARSSGFITMCTGFDEESIDKIFDLDFDIIKVASCSFTDWPLLNKIVDKNRDFNKPIIMSTGGSSLEDMDRVVSFMTNRKQKLTLMHCVAEYPTQYDHLELNQIDLLKNRYPGTEVGYSTHESPDEADAVMISIGKGATAIEKHVALEHHTHSINKYSTTPEQMNKWLNAATKAVKICGVSNQRNQISNKEHSDLLQFKRGVFVNRNIKASETITKNDITVAWPTIDNQVLASDISKYNNIVATHDLYADSPLLRSDVVITNTRTKILDIVQDIKRFLEHSNIPLPQVNRKDLEISHHHGIDNFYTTGLAMLTMINRSYCKKLLILLPNQNHPEQYHLTKEETFIVLYGEVDLTLDGITKKLSAGDTATILPGVKHSFVSTNGCVIEEISTRHEPTDSYYTDETITNNKNRKTIVMYWL